MLVREGCGIRGIGRVLSIAPGTVIARIKTLAAQLRPGMIARGRDYEVDELATYVGNKQNRTWVAYAWERKEHRVAAVRIGKRSKLHLAPLIHTLALAPRRVNGDHCAGFGPTPSHEPTFTAQHEEHGHRSDQARTCAAHAGRSRHGHP